MQSNKWPYKFWFKTQAKHTTNKSPYPTGKKGHKESKHFPSYWMQVRGERDGVPVSWFSSKERSCKLTNRPNSAGMGPGGYKTQSKHIKNKAYYPTGTKGHEESNPIPSYWMQVRERGMDGIPVSWFSDKFSLCKFAKLPNSAGMRPGVYKPSQNIQHISHTIRLDVCGT